MPEWPGLVALALRPVPAASPTAIVLTVEVRAAQHARRRVWLALRLLRLAVWCAAGEMRITREDEVSRRDAHAPTREAPRGDPPP